MSVPGNLLRASLRPVASLTDLSSLLRHSAIQLLPVYYHTASDEPLSHISPLYKVFSVKELRTNLEYLAHNFTFLDAGDLMEFRNNNLRSSKFPAFLSFDDGLNECHTIIRPMLKELGIPAVFFINPTFVGSSDIAYRYKIGKIISALKGSGSGQRWKMVERLIQGHKKWHGNLHVSLLALKYGDLSLINLLMEKLDLSCSNSLIYMSKSQLTDLKNDGFTVGAHSMDHPDFEYLELKNQLNQISMSLAYCQSELLEKYRFFAFPFHDFRLPSILFEKMFGELKIDLSFGTSGLKNDRFPQSIQRLPMEFSDRKVAGIIKTELLYYSLRKLVGKHLLKRE